MSLKSKEFIKTISTEGNDRLRIRIVTEKGQVVNIMVQYEANIAGAWREIVRYDCAHGFLHRDVMLPKGKTEKQPLSITNLNVKKNIGLTFDFVRAAVADPHLLDKIPDGAEIEFLETDLPRIETEERADMGKSPVLFKVERNFQMI